MMSGFNPRTTGGLGGLAGILGGLFGDSGAPYEDAMRQFEKYANQSAGYQNPFFQAGTGALGDMQSWLKGMRDPSGFINSQMNNYKESPWARNLQNEAMRAGLNAGSASGLTGSTPLMQQMQQNAGNISSQDQNQWLQNVLGINTQYGQGLNNMANMGQGAANQLTSLFNQLGMNMGQGAFGQRAGENQDFWNLLGGGASLLGSLFF